VGEPCFGVFEFESHAFQPFLDRIFTPLYAFPCIVEHHEVVGILDAVCLVGDLFSSFVAFSWSPCLFHYGFETMKRNVGKEG